MSKVEDASAVCTNVMDGKTVWIVRTREAVTLPVSTIDLLATKGEHSNTTSKRTKLNNEM